MTQRQSTVFALGLICLLAAASPALQGCADDDDDNDSSGDSTDDSDQGDSGGTDDCLHSDTSPTGLGDHCTEGGGECDGMEADRCLINVGDADLSFCTTEDCTPGSCPCAMPCCDCTGGQFPDWGVFCALQSDVDVAIGKFCTCLL